jgi:hypothetical protein
VSTCRDGRLTWKRKLADGDADFQRAVVLVAVLGDWPVAVAPVDWLQYHEALVARLEES